MNEINEFIEKEYKEFFEWILDREVKLSKTLDLTLCSTKNEPYIYYPEEIESFLKTKPMQRLKRIEQLGTNLLANSDVYHTRFDHCLGTYNNAVLFFIKQYQNSTWRECIQNEDRKIEVLANIMEALRHDDGHNILSHGLEIFIGEEKGAHEILGSRLKKEYKESIEAINNIHPKLLENMEKVSNPNYDLLTLREGNLDFDRLDFLARDLFYFGSDEKKNISYELMSKNEIITVEENGNSKEILVYNYEALPYIENFLETRAEFYKKFVSSNERKGLDILVQQFCETLLNSNINEGKELKEYLEHCKDTTAKTMDLEKFLVWNDLKYYNQLIEIANGKDNTSIRKFALACLPNIDSLCSLAIEALDPKNTDPNSYTVDDLQFLKNIKGILEKEHPLHKKLLTGTTKDSIIILNADSKEEVDEVLQNLRNKGIDKKELDEIITWNEMIKKYNFEEPIYVKDRNGQIFSLDKHPDLVMDLNPIYNIGAVILLDKLYEKGISDEKIKLMVDEFEKFNQFHPKSDLHLARRMKKFQVRNKPYIPEYKNDKEECR